MTPPALARALAWRPTRRLALLCALAAVLAVGACAYLVLGSPLLAARQVRVVGLGPGDGLTAAQVRVAARVPTGGALATLDEGAIRDRIQALPRVAQATVSRSFPHTVRIWVRTRTPVAAVATSTGYAELDSTGHRFGSYPTRPRGLLLVSVATHPRTSPDLPSLPTVGAEVAAGLPAGLAKKVSRIDVAGYDDVTLRLSSGGTVVWGSPQQSAAKARALTGLLAEAKQVGWTHDPRYDVSAPEAPALGRA